MKAPIATNLETPVVVVFDVCDPESINRKYVRGKLGGGRKGLFTNPVVKAFEDRVADAGWWAIMATSAWPKDVWRIAGVTLSYKLFDCRFDADAAIKLVRDALEGVAYQNDRVCDVGALPRPVKDGKGRRIEIRLELHAVYTPDDARALEIASAKRRMRSRKPTRGKMKSRGS